MSKAYVGKFDFQTKFDDRIIDNNEVEKKDQNCRYEILKTFVNNLDIKNVVDGTQYRVFNMSCKHFAFTTSKKTIFNAAKEIQSNVCDDYEKDGLIFTPTNTGVGGSREPLKSKFAWKESFKWKPPCHKTIDFLVQIKKNEKGLDAIYNIFVDGTNLLGTQSILQYKTLELICGFSRQNDGYLNPMLELLNDVKAPVNDNTGEYKPVNFYPTNPADESACYCNVMLDDYDLKTEDGYRWNFSR